MTATFGDVVIRPVGEAEAREILQVYRQCGDFLAICPIPVASMEMVLDDLAHSRELGGVFCGIFRDGAMAGVVDVVPRGFEGDPGVAFLNLLMIARQHRGRGLGRSVVEAVEAWVGRDPAVREMRLGSQVDNVGGVAFWKRMGYEVVGGPKKQPDGTVCYDFVKPLHNYEE